MEDLLKENVQTVSTAAASTYLACEYLEGEKHFTRKTKDGEEEKSRTPQECKVIDFLKERAEESASFAEDVLQEGKSFNDCWEYIRDNARKQAVNGCACIDDSQVYEWAEDYYHRDEAAFIAAREAEEEKRKAARQTAKTGLKPQTEAALAKPAPKKGELEGQMDFASFFDTLRQEAEAL